MNNSDIRFLTMLIILVIISFGFGVYVDSSEHLKDKISLIGITNDPQCRNLSLIETSICLNSEFKSFYRYNESNTSNITLSEVRFKTEGGVCKHAADWYVEKVKLLGFEGNDFSYYPSNITTGHTVAFVFDSNGTSYCIIDQQYIVGCGYLNISSDDLKGGNQINE